MSNRLAVTAIVVNYRTPKLVQQSVDSLFSGNHSGYDISVVLVDGYSNDGSHGELSKFCSSHPSKAVTFLPLKENGGFGWANNQALLSIMGSDKQPDFFYILNPDTDLAPGALANLMTLMMDKPRCAVVGSQLLDQDGNAEVSAFRFPSILSEFVRGTKTALLGTFLGIGDGLITSDSPVECDWVSGASFLVRSSALSESGLFDDGFFLYFEEVELMWRIRAKGWTIWHEPASRVLHLGGASTGLTSRRAQSPKMPQRPAYWYKSRQRFFALTLGPKRAKLAALAWLAGTLIWKVRLVLGLGRSHQEIAREIPDHIRYGLLASSAHITPSIPSSQTQIGARPGWKIDGR